MVIGGLKDFFLDARDAVATEASRFSRRFKGDGSGIAAVEFALLLPIMIALYVGGIEITDAFSIKRKVAGVASALGNLAAQTKTISTSEMDNILDAAGAVIGPYPVADLKVRVSGVWIDEDSVAKVVWSAARNETPETPGSTILLPAGVTYTDTFLIMSQASYVYTPPIGYVVTGVLNLQEEFYQKPRLSSTVCYDGVCELD